MGCPWVLREDPDEKEEQNLFSTNFTLSSIRERRVRADSSVGRARD